MLMLFQLKKFVSSLLYPLPIGLFWIILGLVLLLSNKAKSISTFSLCFGFLIIFIFSLNPVSFGMLNQLQMQYTPLLTTPKNIEYIVVLGGGVSGNKHYPPNLSLGSSSLSRLVEGVRLFKELHRHNPNAQLVLSGGRVFRSPSIAGKMKNTAVILGVDPKNTTLEDGSLDTHQEAVFLQKILGDKPFILVTSAYHMPRSMALFEKIGLHPIPAPTQIIQYHESATVWYVPSAYSLTLTDIAVHEYLGILWAKMQGYIAW